MKKTLIMRLGLALALAGAGASALLLRGEEDPIVRSGRLELSVGNGTAEPVRDVRLRLGEVECRLGGLISGGRGTCVTRAKHDAPLRITFEDDAGSVEEQLDVRFTAGDRREVELTLSPGRAIHWVETFPDGVRREVLHPIYGELPPPRISHGPESSLDRPPRGL